MAAALDAMGHRVFEAGDATWALEQFQRHKPDLVLLDVVMPGRDGYWLAAKMREREAGHWTPIIFLSARDQELDLSRGIESGGDDYLVKPASCVMLAAKLRATGAVARHCDAARRFVFTLEWAGQTGLPAALAGETSVHRGHRRHAGVRPKTCRRPACSTQ